jgi:hypothetical protein
MLAATPSGEVRVAGDHDFRDEMVVWFYRPRIAGGDRLRYYRRGHWPPGGTEWFILHTSDPNAQPGPTFADPRGATYRLVRHYPFAGLSGFAWTVYRNVRAF